MTIGLVGTWLALAAAVGCHPEAATKEGLALPTGVEEELQRYHPEILDTIRETESKLAELEERMIRDEERARFIKSNMQEAARLRSADVDEHRRHLELVCEQGLKLDEQRRELRSFLLLVRTRLVTETTLRDNPRVQSDFENLQEQLRIANQALQRIEVEFDRTRPASEAEQDEQIEQ